MTSSAGSKGTPRAEPEADEPEKNGRGHYVGRLNTVARCRVEAARVYKLMRSGAVPDQHGRRLISSLVDIAGLIDQGELAARLQALEEAELARREAEVGP